MVADVDAAGGSATAAAINGQFVQLDVTDEKSWAALISGLDGRLDIVHLNAGVMSHPRGAKALSSPLKTLTMQTYKKVFDVNVAGVVLGIMAVVPLLQANAGGGDIIVTSSISGLQAFPGDPIYSASKHAVLGLVRGLSPLLSRSGVRLNAICPGVIDTGIVSVDLQRRSGQAISSAGYVAEAVLHALAQGGSGRTWVALSEGRPLYEYTWALL